MLFRRVIQLIKLRAKSVVTAKVSLNITRRHTGRRLNVDEDYYECERLIREPWRINCCNPWVRRLKTELKCAPISNLKTLQLFRARPSDPSICGWEQMGPRDKGPPDKGPPDKGSRSSGRYNKSGEIVLYLSSRAKGAMLEVEAQSVCIQKYSIPCSSTQMKIADFNSRHLSNLLGAAFDLSESSVVPFRLGFSNYKYSNFLASTLKRFKFDGFIVPGVRGSPEFQYFNVILFHPEAWRQWSEKESGYFSSPCEIDFLCQE